MATEMPQDDRGGAHVLASALTLSTLLCAGCMFTPARYRVPQREYPASVERLAVSGFGQRVFEQTEGASSYVGGQYVAGGSNSWAGQYHDVSEAGVFRGKLENTRCVARVEEGNSDSPLRIEGRNGYTGRSAVYTTLAVVEILTLTPFLGVPLANAQGAWAEARL